MAKEKKVETRGEKVETASQPFISQPIRRKRYERKVGGWKNLLSSIATHFPELKGKLKRANMDYRANEFIAMSLQSAFTLTLAIILLAGVIMYTSKSEFLWILVPLFPIAYIVMFFYSMLLPDVKMRKREREMDKELVFAGRQMLIELKAGVPMFDSMLGITRDYGEVSKEFNKIVEKITLGVPADIAMQEVASDNPSKAFNRVIMQLINSLRSGSDVGKALEVVLDQISREQVIALKAYGQKLNPLVMFFLIFGVILPSLGIAFAIILISFVGGDAAKSFGPLALVGAFVLIALIQLMFLTMIETSRPKFDIG